MGGFVIGHRHYNFLTVIFLRNRKAPQNRILVILLHPKTMKHLKKM